MFNLPSMGTVISRKYRREEREFLGVFRDSECLLCCPVHPPPPGPVVPASSFCLALQPWAWDLRMITSVPLPGTAKGATSCSGRPRKPTGSWKPTQQSIQTSILQKEALPVPCRIRAVDTMEGRPGVALLDANC